MLQSEQLFLRFYLTTPLRPPPVVVFDSVTMSVKKIVDSPSPKCLGNDYSYPKTSECVPVPVKRSVNSSSF